MCVGNPNKDPNVKSDAYKTLFVGRLVRVVPVRAARVSGFESALARADAPGRS